VLRIREARRKACLREIREQTGKTISVDNKKILIIDNNDHNRIGIAQIFKKQGYQDIILSQSGKKVF